MSLFNCIGAAMADPEVAMDRTRGEQAQALFAELRERYARELGPDAADAMAGADVKRIMRERAGDKRREALIRLQTMRRLDRHMAEHRDAGGSRNLADAVQAPLSASHAGAIDSVESRAQVLRGFYFGQLTDMLMTFRRNLVGMRQNTALMRDLIAGLHGEAVEGAAKALAEAGRAVSRRARADYNAAGGRMGELDDHGVPHIWSRDRIRGNEAAFKEAVRQRADWSRIIDPTTERPFAEAGQVPSAERVADFLDAVTQNILSDGTAFRKPIYAVQGLGSGRRLDQSRVLHFRSADDWLEVNRQFGQSDPYTAFVTHIDAMARRTALMQVLGPNPRAGMAYIEQVATREVKMRGDRGEERRVANALHSARAQISILDSSANVPVDTMMAGFLAGTRDLLVSAQLGGAMLSAVTDVGFVYQAARHVGMPGGAPLARMVKLMASEGSRAQALRMGVMATHLANAGAAQARWMGEAWGPERTRVVADTVMRASGLSAWTDIGRHAFQLEFMGFLADNVHLPLDRLPEPLQSLFGRRGIDAAMWDGMRRQALHTDDEGATFLVPAIMAQAGDEEAGRLATRLMAVIHEETEFAVPSANLRGRAALGGDLQPGTFAGELLRSGLMYKSFALSLMWAQGRRLAMESGPWRKARYLAQIAAMTTLMGAGSIQLKELAKGRDPRDMDDPQFWGAATLQGGGLGIFGDFLASEQNRFGGGLGGTLSGPAVGAAGDVISFGLSVAGAGGEAAGLMDSEARVGREAVDLARRYMPGGSLWYLSTAWNRMVLDNVQRVLDPEAERSFRQRERRRVRDYGNRSWWRPGRNLPDRAPQIGAQQ